VTVALNELALQRVTASDGRFLFRELPTGTFTLSAGYQSRTAKQTVLVPAGPAQIAATLIVGQP